MTMREVLMLEANRDRYRTPFANACEPLCAIFLSRVGKKSPGRSSALKHGETRRFTRDERKAG